MCDDSVMFAQPTDASPLASPSLSTPIKEQIEVNRLAALARRAEVLSSKICYGVIRVAS